MVKLIEGVRDMKTSEKTFELYYEDLTDRAKKEFREEFGIKDVKSENLDIFPIATIIRDKEGV